MDRVVEPNFNDLFTIANLGPQAVVCSCARPSACRERPDL